MSLSLSSCSKKGGTLGQILSSSPDGGELSSSSDPADPLPPVLPPLPGMPPADPGVEDLPPGTPDRTASVLHFGQVLNSFVQMAGVAPTSSTISTFEEKKGTLSIDGLAQGVNGPQWMAVTSIASEICDDLVDDERNKAAATRRIFGAVNFAANQTQFSNDATLLDSVRRLSRSFWGRNETPEELTLIRAGVTNYFQGVAANVAESRNGAVFLCTSMLASLRSLEI